MKDNLRPGFKRFEFKAGNDGFRWGGELTEGDPASIPPNRLRRLINARLRKNGDVVPRPGLAAFDSSALQASAVIRHIDDYQVTTPVKLWFIGDGCPGLSAVTGFFLGCIDQEQNPELQRAIYYDAASTGVSMAKFDGGLFVGVDAALKRLELILMPWGTENIASDQSEPIITFDTAHGYDANYTISALETFDGKLFIGLRHTASPTTLSKVVTFDGVSVRDDLTGINVPQCFGLYHAPNGADAIVVGLPAASNQIRYRIGGSSPGTWTTVTPGAGTVSAVRMAAYKDVLYIASGSTDVWSYTNAGTLSVARSPAGATAVRGVTNFNYGGTLVFCYDTASAARIGKYDGSTWTDVEKDLTVQFSGTTSVRAVAGYRNNLYACGVRSASGRIWYSPETATSGSYTEIVPAVTNCGDVDQLLVA